MSEREKERELRVCRDVEGRVRARDQLILLARKDDNNDDEDDENACKAETVPALTLKRIMMVMVIMIPIV